MSLAISNKQVVMHPVQKPYYPFLLPSGELLTEYRAFSEEHPLGGLLMDAYELVNRTGAVQYYPILPDGCATVATAFSDTVQNPFLFGTVTTMKKLPVPPLGRVFCLRLQPGAAEWFGLKPVSELTNAVIPLGLLMKDINATVRAIRHAESFHERIVFSVRLLSERQAGEYRRHAVLQNCTETIHGLDGNIRVTELSGKANCSGRYLDRIFQERIGLSTKNYCDIVRFQISLRHIRGSSCALSQCAVDGGYFDLTHMNRDYIKYVGCTAGDIRCVDGSQLTRRALAELCQTAG